MKRYENIKKIATGQELITHQFAYYIIPTSKNFIR